MKRAMLARSDCRSGGVYPPRKPCASPLYQCADRHIDWVFVALPAVPVELLEQGFRSEVLKLLVAERAIGELLSASMLAWRHSGLSVHYGVRVRAGDAEGRRKLAQYMLRAPFSLEKMIYLPETGMVMYRTHMHKGLKHNFQLILGAQWLEMLCRHIPDRLIDSLIPRQGPPASRPD
jgi:hypothetical protein